MKGYVVYPWPLLDKEIGNDLFEAGDKAAGISE